MVLLLPPTFRRMREGNIFTGVCPVPQPLVRGSFWRVYPSLWSQVLSKGVPLDSTLGVAPSQNRGALQDRVPLARVGIPPTAQEQDGYAA